MSRLEFFLLMFPPTQLADMVRLTNDALVRRCRGKTNTTKGEALKLFGVPCSGCNWSRVITTKKNTNPIVSTMGHRGGSMELRHYCIFYRLGTTRIGWYVPIVI